MGRSQIGQVLCRQLEVAFRPPVDEPPSDRYDKRPHSGRIIFTQSLGTSTQSPGTASLSLGISLYISIDSPSLEKLKPPWLAPLAPKPKAPFCPCAWAMPSSAFSSSSEKYFSMMLYAFI